MPNLDADKVSKFGYRVNLVCQFLLPINFIPNPKDLPNLKLQVCKPKNYLLYPLIHKTITKIINKYDFGYSF